MSAAREEVLRRIRGALTDVSDDETPADVAVRRAYRHEASASAEQLVDQLTQTVSDYRARVQRTASADIAGQVAEICRAAGLRRLVVPAELPMEWRPEGVELLVDRRLSARELDRVDGALTGCAAAIAQTGTIVLDGRGACGRRAITLVPDHHICIVAEHQVVGLVPEAIARLRAAVVDDQRPLTLISGPSATSDIELTRVEGVHGPRNLVVLIATA